LRGDWSTRDNFSFRVAEQTISWCRGFRASMIDDREQGAREAWASLGYGDEQIRFRFHFRWKSLGERPS